jgi:hypothetical protein
LSGERRKINGGEERKCTVKTKNKRHDERRRVKNEGTEINTQALLMDERVKN